MFVIVNLLAITRLILDWFDIEFFMNSNYNDIYCIPFSIWVIYMIIRVLALLLFTSSTLTSFDIMIWINFYVFIYLTYKIINYFPLYTGILLFRIFVKQCFFYYCTVLFQDAIIICSSKLSVRKMCSKTYLSSCVIQG